MNENHGNVPVDVTKLKITSRLLIEEI